MKKIIIRLLISFYVLLTILFTIGLLVFNNKSFFATDKYYYLVIKENALNYKKGSLLVFDRIDNYNDLVGKEVYYFDQGNNINISVVDEITTLDNGEYNIEINRQLYKSDRILGKEVKSSCKELGEVLLFFTNPVFFFIMIIFPLVVLLCYEIYLYAKYMSVKDKTDISVIKKENNNIVIANEEKVK